MRQRVWERAALDEALAERVGQALGLPPVVARLLCLRGLSDPEAAARFVEPRIEHLHDPFRLADMRRAVERVETAIARGERIAIHGDYDVDGVTSTVILRRALELLGGSVVHYIPERLREGYGLQPAAVERLHDEGVRLVISVDCGIRAAEAARRARELGVDLIITDHHEPEAALPPALAVVNPKRPDCGYPDKGLAGVGVALKLVQALCARAGRDRWLPSFLKLAAIGTLADVVPLVGENRVIASLGLGQLNGARHGVGLRSLLEATGLQGRPIDSYHVAFMIAPRINAAGRMSSPDVAARLLLTTDEGLAGEARELAEQLNAENQRRQQEEAAILGEARKVIEHDPDVGAHNVLVVAGEGWHRGVIGIVASKLVDAFNKPAVVVSIDGEAAHGSCRSIPAFDMLAGLDGCAELFERHGGHRQAAGFTMDARLVPALRQRLTRHADDVLSPDDLRPRLTIDAPLSLDGITPEAVEGIERLAPFGNGNPRPVFEAAAVGLAKSPVRLKDRHLTMTVRQGGRMFRAIAWRAAERFDFFDANREAFDLAYSLERNTFRGETTIELTVVDAREPALPGGAS
jgi:single-stranded-DNA-specific exonuclease